MKIVDVVDSQRINRAPDKTLLILSQDYSDQGYTVKKIELRLYVEKIDKKLGPFSLITAYIETDKGSIEMLYDEGYRGENSLERAKDFLIMNLGISGLITRSLLSLNEETNRQNS